MFGLEFRSHSPFAARTGVVPDLKLAIDGDDGAATATYPLRNFGERQIRGRKQ
jgi:hypothetical protein